MLHAERLVCKYLINFCGFGIPKTGNQCRPIVQTIFSLKSCRNHTDTVNLITAKKSGSVNCEIPRLITAGVEDMYKKEEGIITFLLYLSSLPPHTKKACPFPLTMPRRAGVNEHHFLLFNSLRVKTVTIHSKLLNLPRGNSRHEGPFSQLLVYYILQRQTPKLRLLEMPYSINLAHHFKYGWLAKKGHSFFFFFSLFSRTSRRYISHLEQKTWISKLLNFWKFADRRIFRF